MLHVAFAHAKRALRPTTKRGCNVCQDLVRPEQPLKSFMLDLCHKIVFSKKIVKFKHKEIFKFIF